MTIIPVSFIDPGSLIRARSHHYIPPEGLRSALVTKEGLPAMHLTHLRVRFRRGSVPRDYPARPEMEGCPLQMFHNGRSKAHVGRQKRSIYQHAFVEL